MQWYHYLKAAPKLGFKGEENIFLYLKPEKSKGMPIPLSLTLNISAPKIFLHLYKMYLQKQNHG